MDTALTLRQQVINRENQAFLQALDQCIAVQTASINLTQIKSSLISQIADHKNMRVARETLVLFLNSFTNSDYRTLTYKSHGAVDSVTFSKDMPLATSAVRKSVLTALLLDPPKEMVGYTSFRETLKREFAGATIRLWVIDLDAAPQLQIEIEFSLSKLEGIPLKLPSQGVHSAFLVGPSAF